MIVKEINFIFKKSLFRTCNQLSGHPNSIKVAFQKNLSSTFSPVMLAKIAFVLVFFVGALAGPAPTAADSHLLSLHNQARGGGLSYDKRLFAVNLLSL